MNNMNLSKYKIHTKFNEINDLVLVLRELENYYLEEKINNKSNNKSNNKFNNKSNNKANYKTNNKAT